MDETRRKEERKMKKLLKEFREFALKGSVMDLAIGMMIGAAFGAVVSSLVNDLLMPLIGRLLGNVDFTNLFIALDGGSYASLAIAQEAGAPIFAYGKFISTVIDFILLALCVFLIVKAINSAKKKMQKPAEPAPAPRLCPFCFGEIHEQATRCPHCTAELPKEDNA